MALSDHQPRGDIFASHRAGRVSALRSPGEYGEKCELPLSRRDLILHRFVFFISVILLTVSSFDLCLAQQMPKRIALAIGNGAYIGGDPKANLEKFCLVFGHPLSGIVFCLMPISDRVSQRRFGL